MARKEVKLSKIHWYLHHSALASDHAFANTIPSGIRY